MLNELQRYSASGRIDTGILVNISDDNFSRLIGILKIANFKENNDIDSSQLFRKLYDTACEHIDEKSIPLLILHIANYSYKAAFVADQEINLAACLMEIMNDCKFK